LNKYFIISASILVLIAIFVSKQFLISQDKPTKNMIIETKVNKSEKEWKEILSPEEYNVLRNKGTERPGTGEYNLHFEDGNYNCKGCGNLLFTGETKFDSHCGWPSFYDVESNEAIRLITDKSLGMVRTEVVCAKCDGHLGHVFEDGPEPTGLRYCINSVSISFKKDSTKSDK